MMEQAVILSENCMVAWNRPVTNRPAHPAFPVVPSTPTPPVTPAVSPAPPPPAAPLAEDIKSQREYWEKERILQALLNSRERIRGTTGAATLLGIKPTTLEAKMKKLGILKKHVM